MPVPRHDLIFPSAYVVFFVFYDLRWDIVVRFVDNGGIRLFRIISIPSKGLLFSSARPHDFDGMLGTGLPVSMYTMHRFNISELKEFLAFSVKDKYQLNYFICIKDFNVQTITSLKLNLFSSFIYCCQHHERKTTCLDIFLLSDRQWDTDHQYLLSQFLGVSILQLLIIYRIYDYDMLTLSQ